MPVNPAASSNAQLAQSVSKSQMDSQLVQSVTRTVNQNGQGRQTNNGINPTVKTDSGATVNAQGQTIGSNLNVKA